MSFLETYDQTHSEVLQHLRNGWTQVHCDASALRKNQTQTPGSEYVKDSALDGVIVCTAGTSLELCTIKAAAVNSGPTSARVLADRRTLSKDMMDAIRRTATVNIWTQVQAWSGNWIRVPHEDESSMAW